MSTLEEEIRRIVREEIQKVTMNPFPLPPVSSTRCPVCSIEWGNQPWGYVCQNSQCPNMARGL